MGRLGDDWLWIGLGIGAIIMVNKLTKPAADLGQSTADSFGGVVKTGGSVAEDWLNAARPTNILPKTTLPEVTLPSLPAFSDPVKLVKDLINLWPIPGNSGIPAAPKKAPKTQTPASSQVTGPNYTPAVKVDYVAPNGVQYGTYQTPTGGVSGIIPASQLNYSPISTNQGQSIAYW